MMNSTISTDPVEVVETVGAEAIPSQAAKFLTSRLAKPMALLIVAGALAAAPPSHAQRGGGSSAGGGHFGGGGTSSSAGGGSRASGAGGGGHATGARSGGSGKSSGPSTSTGKGDSAVHQSGFGAAVRRFFGLAPASKSRVREGPRQASGVGSSTSLPGKPGSGMPAVFSHVHLAHTPSAFDESSLSAKPAINAPPRPIRPHPRGPYPPGRCYTCGFDFGFGFGLPLFYSGYWDWSPPFWHGSTQSGPSMLLYMQDGSAFEVTDYWVEDDALNYVTVDGTEGSISVATLDLQRTIDANARVGLKFTLDRTRRGLSFERIPEQLDPKSQAPPQQEPDEGQAEMRKPAARNESYLGRNCPT
jgi:hypothetical protein